MQDYDLPYAQRVAIVQAILERARQQARRRRVLRLCCIFLLSIPSIWLISRVLENTHHVVHPTIVPTIHTSPITTHFYASDASCSFTAPVTRSPLLSMSFARVDFAGRPLLSDPQNAHPQLVEDHGSIVGKGPLHHFDAIVTGTFTVSTAMTTTITFLVDDAVDVGIGNGAVRLAGTLVHPPESGHTVLSLLPILASFNDGPRVGTAQLLVRFPHAGDYPYELDWTECGGGGETLHMEIGDKSLNTAP